MKDFKWYRWLRGGMWVCVFQEWKKVPERKYSDALHLMQLGFNVEDHRYVI